MSDGIWAAIAVGGLIIVVVFILGCTAGRMFQEGMEHKQAVKAGVGRYEADATTGEVRFRYGTQTEGK